MSGGVAYVYDQTGLFPDRVNREMVALEPLDSEDDLRLYGLVERHLMETGSVVAERLLADWAISLEHFVKVMPSDYRRVLDAQQRAAEQGIDPTDAMMEAAHG
jgi:glutamate synthase (NADPH/NADH) large chain